MWQVCFEIIGFQIVADCLEHPFCIGFVCRITAAIGVVHDAAISRTYVFFESPACVWLAVIVLDSPPPDGIADSCWAVRLEHVDGRACLDGIDLLAYNFKCLVDRFGKTRFDATVISAIDDA